MLEIVCLQKYACPSDGFLRQCKAINLEGENVILFMASYIPSILQHLYCMPGPISSGGHLVKA